jgi:3,4-dihydroxy 2-butanone 4-phosphate synthase/GTP cyclohydrolase II
MSSVEAAIEQIRRGGIAIVVDDEDRENEGDLIMAAEAVGADDIAFFLQHTSGFICACLTGERCTELQLPQMVADNREGQGTAFTVTVDAASGVSTGISAGDRARTIAMLADPGRGAADFVRPGHVPALRAREGGVLKRAGHTEAAVDLARLAGRAPAAVLCEVVSADKRRMARRDELERLAAAERLPLITIADLLRHRLRGERLVEHV